MFCSIEAFGVHFMHGRLSRVEAPEPTEAGQFCQVLNGTFIRLPHAKGVAHRVWRQTTLAQYMHSIYRVFPHGKRSYFAALQ